METRARLLSSPICKLIDVKTCGGALLLTSSCDVGIRNDDDGNIHAASEVACRICNNTGRDMMGKPCTCGAGLAVSVASEEANTFHIDDRMKPPKVEDGGPWQRRVHGGVYRLPDVPVYRTQSLLGVELIRRHLIELGVPAGLIEHADYSTDRAPDLDPAQRILKFFRFLKPQSSMAILYFCGPSAPGGEWAFDWVDKAGQRQSILLHPRDLQPAPSDWVLGPPGQRFVLSDSPFTADTWGVARPHLIGTTAWATAGLQGADGGPPLSRWLSGWWQGDAPEGVRFFPLPKDTGLKDLPAYRAVFWGPRQDMAAAESLLWEVQAFVGASTRASVSVESNLELFDSGFLHVIIELLMVHETRVTEALLAQSLWLIRSLAANSNVSRWLGQMAEALRVVLEVVFLKDNVSLDLVTATLDLVATCLSRDRRCQDCLAPGRAERRMALALASRCFATEPPNLAAFASACQMASQLGGVHELDFGSHGDRELFESLARTLLHHWGEPTKLALEVQRTSAEALKMCCFRGLRVRQRITSMFMEMPRFLEVLECADESVVSELLGLIRTLTTPGPEFAAAEENSSGDKAPPLLPHQLPDAIVHCLCKYPDSKTVQRWGLSALGALAIRGFAWANDATSLNIVTCLLWTLGTDSLDHDLGVEAEALFCSYAVLTHLGSTKGREKLTEPNSKFTAFISSGVARAAEASARGGQSSPVVAREALRWGIHVLGLLAAGPGGPSRVAPFADAIVLAVLAPSCNEVIAIACVEALSMILAGCAEAKDIIEPKQKQLLKSLQIRARDLPQAQRERMESWVNVLVEALGIVEPYRVDDSVNTPWKPLYDENAPDTEVFPYDIEKQNEEAKKSRIRHRAP